MFTFEADGTYTYYVHENGEWIASDNIMNEYNVDGDWMATRWMKQDSIEMRKWWNIDVCNADEMSWSALRADTFGQHYSATFRMRRIVE